MQAPHEGATILCLSSYFKGNQFLEECKRAGWRVVLVTLEPLLSKAWAREFIDEIFALTTLHDQRLVVQGRSRLPVREPRADPMRR